jgi:hypothetical protein
MKKLNKKGIVNYATEHLPLNYSLHLYTLVSLHVKICPNFLLVSISCAQDEINPAADYTPKVAKGYIISHTYYTLSYSNADRPAEFAYYFLSLASINGSQDRTDDFRIDPSVKSNPVTSISYQGSGFDRGHLAPSADFKLNEKAMSETFFMSNMPR